MKAINNNNLFPYYRKDIKKQFSTFPITRPDIFHISNKMKDLNHYY